MSLCVHSVGARTAAGRVGRDITHQYTWGVGYVGEEGGGEGRGQSWVHKCGATRWTRHTIHVYVCTYVCTHTRTYILTSMALRTYLCKEVQRETTEEDLRTETFCNPMK